MIDPRTLRAILRAVIAGLCLAASIPPWGWWPLAFLGIAMWDRLLRNAKPRARIVRSVVFAAAWFTPSMLWMVDLTVPGYLIAIVVFSLYVGVAGLAVPGRSSSPWMRWLALPAAFTLAEAARCTFPFGGVPLATTAMGQASAPLGQIARVLCAVGVTFAVAVIGVALSAAWERRHVIAATALVGVIALWLTAIVAPAGHDIRTINAAVVQGGGPQGTRASETNSRDVFDRHVEATSLVTTPVDLVVWPENVVAVDSLLETAKENAELSALAKDLNTTLVAGITEDLDSSSFANASIVYLPDGSTGERYDKVRRVPFGEYVPLRWLIESVAGSNTGIPFREARAGTKPAIVRTPAGDLALAISWEIFFTNRGRDGVLLGGQILLNPTNGSSYWLTQVQTQQVASSQLRAIETGRWILQAAPTGFSAIVNPSGEVLERTSISEQSVLQQDVMLRSGDTIATVIGPMPVIWLSVILLALSWWFATNHFEVIRSKLKSRRSD